MEKQAYTEMDEVESNHWWFKARRDILSRTISHYSYKKLDNILEIGCGTGGNIAMLQSLGKTDAIEMDSYAIELLEKKHKIDIINGAVPKAIDHCTKKYDLVCLFDVLEHIEDDIETLNKIREVLTPDGMIVFTVPAYQFLFGPHDKFLHHKKRYRRSELYSIISNLNHHYSIVKLSYFNFILLPLAIVERILTKFLNLNKKEVKTPNKFINNIFYNIFSFEKKIINNFNIPFGLSIICIVKNNTIIEK
ncbi:class I SAM-dependent methyltransferase [Vibrio sp. RC27]